MTIAAVLNFVTLFCAGLLAGALLIVDYGVGRAVATIPDAQTQIKARQALIRTLRILVPTLFIPTILLGIASALMGGTDQGFIFRCAGAVLVAACFLLTLIGTAPINKTIGDWDANTPPANWRALISRWEWLDMVRTWIGLIAFALLLAGTALNTGA